MLKGAKEAGPGRGQVRQAGPGRGKGIYFRSPQNCFLRRLTVNLRTASPLGGKCGGRREDQLRVLAAQSLCRALGLGRASILSKRLLIRWLPWVENHGQHWGHEIVSNTTLICCLGANSL